LIRAVQAGVRKGLSLTLRLRACIEGADRAGVPKLRGEVQSLGEIGYGEGRRFLIRAVQAGVRKGQSLTLRLRACIEGADRAGVTNLRGDGPISGEIGYSEEGQYSAILRRKKFALDANCSMPSTPSSILIHPSNPTRFSSVNIAS
jgi:hypothetical protein